MLMELHCPSCGMRLRIDQKFAGRKGRCPNCRNKMLIPAADAPGVLLVPTEPAAPEKPRMAAEAEARAEEPETTDRKVEAIYVAMPIERHRYTPPTIQLLFREQVKLFIAACPRWALSLAAHLAIFFILSVCISITSSPPTRYIPVQGRFVEAEMPQKMVDLEVKEEERPRVDDILTSTSPVTTTAVARPTFGDPTGIPTVGPVIGTGGDTGPPIIGFDVGAAASGGFSSLGGGGRGFTPGSFGVSKTSVRFFGNEAKRGAESIIFIVDASTTMGEIGRRFERAVAELRSSIEKLTAGHRFNIIFFSDQPIKWMERMVVASPENKRLALEFVESMREFKPSGTLPVPPMKEAIAENPDVIFFLTDGDFLADDGTELLALLKDKKIRIYPIGYGDKVNEPLLQKLADLTQGRYTPAKM